MRHAIDWLIKKLKPFTSEWFDSEPWIPGKKMLTFCFIIMCIGSFPFSLIFLFFLDPIDHLSDRYLNYKRKNINNRIGKFLDLWKHDTKIKGLF